MSPRQVGGVLAVVLFASGCSQGPALRGRILGLSTTVADAEKNGAMTCAPRELAVAKSQLEFATIDLDQGQLSKAEAHLAKAEPNAQAAFSMSPADRCSAREFVEVEPPKPGDTDGDGIPDSVRSVHPRTRRQGRLSRRRRVPRRRQRRRRHPRQQGSSAPTSRRTSTATRTMTAARTRTTTATGSPMSTTTARTRQAYPGATSPGARGRARSSW